MHVKYRPTVEGLSPPARHALMRELGVSDACQLWSAASEASHAAVTLFLLGAGFLTDVEAMIGHPIVRPPPGYRALSPVRGWWAEIEHLQAMFGVTEQARSAPPNERLSRLTILAVHPRTNLSPDRKPQVTWWHEFLHPGVRLQQLVVTHGVPRRGLNQAIADGWLEVHAQ